MGLGLRPSSEAQQTRSKFKPAVSSGADAAQAKGRRLGGRREAPTNLLLEHFRTPYEN